MKASRKIIAGETADSRFQNNVELTDGLRFTPSGTPTLEPVAYSPVAWVSFNLIRQQRAKSGKGIHFFVHDYQFERIWNRPEVNAELIRQYDAVMTPDFSLYTDWPVAVQKWNHYRKHVLGAWWQKMGMTVYPTISWSDDDSFDWCFDGEPEHSTVCVSSVGVMASPVTRQAFRKGYDAMMERLQPETILFFGKVPEGLTGNIQEIGHGWGWREDVV